MTRGVLIAALLLALGGLFYTLQKIDDVEITAAAPDAKLPRYTLTDVLLTRYDADGMPALHLQAQQLEYFDDESAHGDMLKLDVLAGTSQPWHATATAGRLPARSHVFELQDDVVANGAWPDTGEPVTVNTKRLWVDPDKHELRNEVPLTFASATRDGSATGMVADWSQKNLHLLDDVKIHYDAKH